MNEVNPDLQATADALGDLADGLRAAREASTDPDAIKAINNELIEVNHRVTMVGTVLFHQRTTAITAAATKVADAKGDVLQEIAKLDSITRFIQTVSGFLGIVDKVVDLAKTAI